MRLPRPRVGLALAAVAAVVLGSMATVAALAPTSAQGAAPKVSSGGLKIAYYDQWSIYQNAFYIKNLDTEGIAGKLDYLIYDFENIDPTNLTCFEAEHATDPDPAGENDPNAGDGGGDVDADYGKTFTADQAVNGQADTYGQLAGNFHQLQELKAKYPNLKILLSIGGWTYSKYFSDVAATAASRQKFVSSCVNMFIKGNLPPDPDYGVTPAAGAIAGLFSGFDIDWEYPGSSAGHLGNHYGAADTANFTALLGEFRSELNAAGSGYALSAALPGGQDKIAKIQTNQIGQYLTFGDAMTYDMHGAWDTTGPTNFQDPLYPSPSDPSNPISPGTEKYNTDSVVKDYLSGSSAYGIPGGFPASKLTLGVPFYYRGWTGVPAGSNHGLYQSATGPSAGHTLSGNVPGVAMYKELTGVVDNPSDTFWDPTTRSAWFYDGSNFYGGESAQSIQARADYVHCSGLAGAMMFSLYDLDPAATLFNDVVNDINGTTSTCTSPTASPTPTSTTSSPSPSPTPTATTPPPTGGTGAVVNGGFESGSLSPWTCDAGTASVVPSPVYSGSHALQGVPTSSADAQCTQTVTVTPGQAYTLSGWVDGSYVYIGVSGGATASTWTPGTAGAFSKLSVAFTPTSSSVTVYVHGWYGQPTYQADDLSVA
jgi:chitinase